MLDEVLFMEARIFSGFIKRTQVKPREANRMFERYGIWNYIEQCYDSLHMSGDEYVLNDIECILRSQGAIA